jgi:DNA-directed RNA polymerase subunit RPC12/RpoP
MTETGFKQFIEKYRGQRISANYIICFQCGGEGKILHTNIEGKLLTHGNAMACPKCQKWYCGNEKCQSFYLDYQCLDCKNTNSIEKNI